MDNYYKIIYNLSMRVSLINCFFVEKITIYDFPERAFMLTIEDNSEVKEIRRQLFMLDGDS
ncbi:hypothetical protein KHA80_15175 [Anaerobacillus sp. HL2]|nr:hypothetical protein KHA80_15175 [Anaerobacillus sp. HL2]